MRNKHLGDFASRDDREWVGNRLADVFAQGTVTFEVYLLQHDGLKVPFLCNFVALRNGKDEVIGYTGTGRDISERKAMHEQMQRMASFDMLTELPNRTMLSERLQFALMQGRREQCRFAILFLDLDMFKYINDKFGHDIGDKLLKQAAGRIASHVQPEDTPSRIGGDEFAVLLHTQSEKDALQIAENIRQSIHRPFEINGLQLSISASIGIAFFPDHGADEKELLKNADTAMYLAKKKGRNAIAVFSEV